VNNSLYSVRVGESHYFAEGVPYGDLLKEIMEFTIRAAVARSIDESDWEQDELRRNGLAALEIFRDGKAVWSEPQDFDAERIEACREHAESRFDELNAVDPTLYQDLDRDLRDFWRKAGYQAPCLRNEMKKLFIELEHDIADRAARARESLVGEVLGRLFTETS